MTRFLLVPEDFDLKKIKELDLPSDIYPHKKQLIVRETTQTQRGRFLPLSVAKMTSNPILGKKLLKFLKNNNFRDDGEGGLLLDGELHPISLHSNFLDLINEAPKTKKSSKFYNLLREKKIDKRLVPSSKQKYFVYK